MIGSEAKNPLESNQKVKVEAIEIMGLCVAYHPLLESKSIFQTPVIELTHLQSNLIATLSNL
jgi:hypothetical protein